MDEARDNLCTECRGSGCYPILWGVDYWEEANWEEIACRSCNTTGTITTIPTEEDVSLSRLIHHIMPGSASERFAGPYGPTKVYRENVAEYNEWLDSLR